MTLRWLFYNSSKKTNPYPIFGVGIFLFIRPAMILIGIFDKYIENS